MSNFVISKGKLNQSRRRSRLSESLALNKANLAQTVAAKCLTFTQQMLTVTALLSMSTPVAAQTIPDPVASPDYRFIQRQINQAEAAEAKATLRAIISKTEVSTGQYAQALIEPLKLLGNAQMATQEYQEAIETFDKAVHLTRVNFGLFTPKQAQMVYKQADAYAALNDYSNAQQREEYAFSIIAARTTKNEILQALTRLGDFYMAASNPLSARIRYRQGLELLRDNGQSESPAAISFLEGMAKSHTMERFPPFYARENRGDEFMQRPDTSRTFEDGNQIVTVNNFAEGERALQKIIRIKQNAAIFDQETPDTKALLLQKSAVNGALLKLADWHLLFNNQRRAHTLYEEIHQRQQEYPEPLQVDMSTPTVLYFPEPVRSKPPAAQDRLPLEIDTITLSFSVYPNGRIRELKTTTAQVNDKVEFHARRSARRAIYRPAYAKGKATITVDHEYDHNFEYFPSRKKREKERAKELRQAKGAEEPKLVEDDSAI
jgi:tetratricopeptide (TPR) repeat protein